MLFVVSMPSKYSASSTEFVRIAQGGAEQALVERLDSDDVLAMRHHDAGQRDPFLVLHGVADQGEGVYAGLAVGREVIGVVEVALVDFVSRHKIVDLDGVAALDLHGGELILFDRDILALLQLVAAALLVAFDDSPVSASIICCFSRLPVSLLIMWKRVFSTEVEAGRGRPDRRPTRVLACLSSRRGGPLQSPAWLGFGTSTASMGFRSGCRRARGRDGRG